MSAVAENTRDADQSETIAERVAAAYDNATPLAIRAGNSKTFLGESGRGEMLDVSTHRGVVSYEPGELVLTARSATPLAEIEAVLADAGQQLAFEPPHFGGSATIGGTIAAGLSGPARPFSGAVRDFVLGARIVNGRGEPLRFGGEVMKNVAGYDVSRLMVGAFGTLGVLLDVSLKVLPVARRQVTQVFEHDAETALEAFKQWRLRPWPITGAYWENNRTYLRLAGAETAVVAAQRALGGQTLAAADRAFWASVREQDRAFFTRDERPLWRLSLPPAAPLHTLDGDTAIDWGGAQRWLLTDADAATLRETVAAQGGHASVYSGNASPRFHPLSASLATLHQRLKASMDPAGILNPGRMYPDL